MCKVNFRDLYRGKRIDSDEWVYGAYISTPSHHFIIPEESDISPGINNVIVEVIPELVSQSTNISAWYIDDDNNTETTLMFGGDAVCYDDGNVSFTGVVTQECGAWGITSSDLSSLDLRYACGCDNFVSFWELMWNCDDPDCLVDGYVPNLKVFRK